MILTENEMRLRPPDDFHVHLRDGDMLEEVIGYTGKVFKRALVMPNLRPNPVLTGQDAIDYLRRIMDAREKMGCQGFEPLMTIQVTAETTPQIVSTARLLGVVAAKFYPQHGTTNSDNGLPSVSDIPEAVLKAMSDCGMVLCVHAEKPGEFVLDRERVCLGPMRRLCEDHPKLKIVWEHISTTDAATMVQNGPENLFGTITAHHLVLTLDDILARGIRPDHHCMPVPNSPRDRDAVVAAAVSGNPRIGFGSDSAPHSESAKYCQNGAAGVFSAPVALPLLAHVFEKHRALDRLEDFVSRYGAEFYGLPLNEGEVVLTRDEGVYMPRAIGRVDSPHKLHAFMSGKKLGWRVTKTPNWEEK